MIFEDLKNEIDFFLRNKIQISRKNYIEKSKKQIEINIAQNKYYKEYNHEHLPGHLGSSSSKSPKHQQTPKTLIHCHDFYDYKTICQILLLVYYLGPLS